jgi:hypothetical protein
VRQELRTLRIDDGCAICTYGNLFVTVLSTASTMSRLRDIRRPAADHHGRWPGDVRSMNVVESTSVIVSRMTDEVRAESAALTKDFSSNATAFVVEGGGFSAAAVRALLAGFYFVARPKSPHRIEATVEAGADWLLRRTPTSTVPMTTDEVLAAVDAARRELRRGAAA